MIYSIKVMDLSEIKKVYFIGIGGIGMSALVRMLAGEGKEVFGSDRAESLVTAELEKLGIKIFYNQEAQNITPDIDLVVYTIAVPDNHPELMRARELGLECKTYPEMLGLISANKYTIAVAGTHGKTTVTAMIADIMIKADLSPTVIVGSLLKSGTNFIKGNSQYLVVEACEYRRSFLNLHPQLAVVTNIDSDHLDYYKDLDDIKSAFAQFLEQSENKIVDYGQYVEKVPVLLIPGEHNRLNAGLALAVASYLGIDEFIAREALSQFAGTWRRFEYKGKTASGALVYDDYAHHPTELKATIQAGREFMAKNNLTGKLIIAFQPHLYSRTKLLKDDFAQALVVADRVILLPIYAARENLDESISSDILADLIKQKGGQVIVSFDQKEASKIILEFATVGDLVITVGAGDISNLALNLL